MRDEALGALRCPVCGAPLLRRGTTLACARRHAFDLARQGYVNLVRGTAAAAGDSAGMVAARAAFLARGHYAFITEALTDQASAVLPRVGHPTRGRPPGTPEHTAPALVVDVGAGTGHHLAGILAALPGAVGLALDASKAAARRAARAHPRLAAAVVDTWDRLPVGDATAALLLNVFAPRNGEEFRRILRPDGALLVVTPTERHQTELIDVLGLLRVDPAKRERVAATLRPHFAPAGRRRVAATLRLSHDEVRDLVAMGPSARHVDAARLTGRLAAAREPIHVTASVELTVWRPTTRWRPVPWVRDPYRRPTTG